MKTLKTISAGLTALSMVLTMSFAQATTLTFEKVTNNAKNVDLSPQLFVDVDAVYTGSDITGATFSIRNEITSAEKYGSISEIYFDYSATTNFDSIVIDTQVGTDFCDTNTCVNGASKPVDVHPGELPGSTFSSEYAADSTGNPVNGVDHADDELIFLAVLGDWTYKYMLDAFESGEFRIGFHIQAIDRDNDNNYSDSYQTVSTVPVPAAAWLFGTALLGFFAAGRRKKIS